MFYILLIYFIMHQPVYLEYVNSTIMANYNYFYDIFTELHLGNMPDTEKLKM